MPREVIAEREVGCVFCTESIKKGDKAVLAFGTTFHNDYKVCEQHQKPRIKKN